MEVLISLGLLLIIAKLFEGVASRLRQSSMVAYVAAGIILGPVLGLVEATADLDLFFGIGVIFLFFLIGAEEMDVSGLAATLRGRFFLAGTLAFLVSFGFALAVMLSVLDLPVKNAIAVAGILALSSLGVVAKVLSDLGRLREPAGLEIFTTVVILEIIGLLVVSFSIRDIAGEEPFTPWTVPILLAEIVAFSVVSWLLASRVFPPVVAWLRRFIDAPQLAMGLMTGALLLVVGLVDRIGIHGSLGALLLGVSLSGLPHRLRTDILPGVRGLAYGSLHPAVLRLGRHVPGLLLHRAAGLVHSCRGGGGRAGQVRRRPGGGDTGPAGPPPGHCLRHHGKGGGRDRPAGGSC